LVFGQFDRCFDQDVAVQITGVAGAHAFDALAAQPELLAGLGAFGDVNRRLARQRGHVNFAAQCGGDDADRYRAVQVIAVALEDIVFLEADFDVQVTRWSAIGPRLTIAGAANTHAAVDTRWNFDFQRFLLLDLALAMAGRAGLRNHLARAATGGTGLLHAEKALAHLHRSAATTGAAGLDLGAWFGTAAMAGVAVVPTGDADLCILAGRRLFECDFHRVTEVAAAIHLAPATGTATLLAKHVTKDVTKRFGKTAVGFSTTRTAAHIGVDAGKPVLIVSRPFLRVGEHFVSLLALLELLFGGLGRITLIAVGVMLHRVFAIRFFDFVFRGVLGYAQNLVVISFSHGLFVPGCNANAALTAQGDQRGASCVGQQRKSVLQSGLFDFFDFSVNHIVVLRRAGTL
jgi:hypothetical protein